MLKKLVLAFAAIAALLVPLAASASSSSALPPVCVERNLPAQLHLQVGYCPGP